MPDQKARIIRRLNRRDAKALFDISGNAYPAFVENEKHFRQRYYKSLEIPKSAYYGLFRQGKLVGSYRAFEFEMNVRSRRLPVCGLGAVAVDMSHKKEKVCRDMLRHFLAACRERGACLAALYGFRPEFYRKMGFGYGARMYRYEFPPAYLRGGDSKNNATIASKRHTGALLSFYNRMASKIHGMILRDDFLWERDVRPSARRIAVCRRGGKITGYVVFDFIGIRDENPFEYGLEVFELLCQDRESLSELITFLGSQADQVNRVVLNTHRDDFAYLLNNVGNPGDDKTLGIYHRECVSGLGMMYRVIDVPGLFRSLRNADFGPASLRVKFDIRDDFLPSADASVIAGFDRGRAALHRKGGFDVEVSMNAADFSSLLMGCVSLKSLYTYKLAEISDTGLLDVVDGIFGVVDRPACYTVF